MNDHVKKLHDLKREMLDDIVWSPENHDKNRKIASQVIVIEDAAMEIFRLRGEVDRANNRPVRQVVKND